LAVGTVLVAAFATAVNAADSYNNALGNLTSQTGTTAAETAGLEKAFKNVYKAGYGEDINDVADAMANVKQQTGATNEELEKQTKKVMTLSKAMGTDYGETIRSVDNLAKNLGITHDEAFEMVAQGYQKGLNANGDYLDVLDEYSVQVKKAGLSADEFFSIMVAGHENGVFSLDKLIDMQKEFNIRAIDGSKGTLQAYSDLGLSYADLSKEIAAGGETGKQAQQKILKAILQVKDPLKQSEIGVALLGTMYEDLGVDGVKSLADLENGIDDTKSAMDELTAANFDSIGESFKKLGRTFEVNILIPIGKVLAPVVQTAFKIVSTVLEAIPTPVALVGAAFAALILVLAAVTAVVAGLVVGIGALATAITTLVGIVSTIGLPIILTVVASLAGLAVAIGAVVAVTGVIVAAWTVLIAKMGILGDAIATVKALLSGDFNTMFDTLTKRLGMNSKEAEKLARAFETMADKAKTVIAVIKENIGPAFDALKDTIGELISGGFKKLDGSTEESKNLFIDMVQGIVKWGSELFDYLYNLFDEFGLIPIELKFTNDKIAGEFVELKSKMDSNFRDILSLQTIFGGELTASNLKHYNQKLADTKASMDKELAFVMENLEKRRETELTGLQTLFEESRVLTEAEEAKRLEEANVTFANQALQLQQANERIKEILTIAAQEKRELTVAEAAEIQRLRTEAQQLELETITTNKAEQRRILEEASMTARNLSREEALSIIADANKAYDATVAAAKKQKDEKISLALNAYENLGVISKSEKDALIAEAQKEYEGVVDKAAKTKDKTINYASQKAAGLISEADKERREVTSAAEKIEAILKRIWEDIKRELPKKARAAFKDIERAIIAQGPSIASAAFRVGARLIAAIIEGINSKFANLLGKIAKVGLALNPLSGSKLLTGHAEGIVNSPIGHLAIVGEKGPELMWVPQHASVYTANETKTMLAGATSSTREITQINKAASPGVTKVTNEYTFTGPITLHLEDLEEMQKASSIINGLATENIMRGG